jgi:hypothetical protein
MIQMHVSDFILVGLASLRVKELVGTLVICPDCSYSLTFEGSGFKSECRPTGFGKKGNMCAIIFR